jgi:hypothetical protein
VQGNYKWEKNVPLRDDDVNAINALGEVDLLDLTLNQRDHCRERERE